MTFERPVSLSFRALRTLRTLRGLPAVALLALLVVPVGAVLSAHPAAAQGAPDPLFKDFEQIGQFALVIDDQVQENAEIFKCDAAGAILVMCPTLEQPILFNLRSRQIAKVPIMSLAQRPGGTVDILADASLVPAGTFSVGSEGASVNVDGRTLALTERESLTGARQADELLDYDPAYARGAKSYSPNETLIQDLRGQDKEIRVEVFFNSKCSVCKQMVPRIIKLDQVLEDDVVEFSYYGVPDSYKDPEMEKRDITGVPTGIVYVNGKEVGRIVGGQWKIPELAIKTTILKAS